MTPARLEPGFQAAAYRHREARMRFRQYANGHRLRRTTRVACSGRTPDRSPCPYRAEFCEYRRWTLRPAGVAFDHWCAACWRTPGPDGTTPHDRATAREARS